MRIHRILSFVACAALCLPCPLPARAGADQLFRIWDLRDTSQPGQLSIFNDDQQGSLLGEPVGSGDVDGDGFADVVLAPFYAPSGPENNKQGGGKLHLYFGGPDVLDGGVVYDAASPPANAVEVWGARGGDFLGNEVDVADVTGDGLADILACAQNADGFDASEIRSQAGALYVILGRESWTSPINLADSPDGVIQILGARQGDRLGFWAVGGDVTGDGTKDILVSADLAPGPTGAGSARGVLYIIPGGPNLPSRIDLGSDATLSQLGVTRIHGVDDGDHLGSSIAVGDFDGDGLGDVAVGAGVSRAGAGFSGYGQPSGVGSGGGDGPNENRDGAGEVYIVFGRASWPAAIQLSSPPSDVAIFYGDQPNGYFGEDVRAGDVDGDGRDELGVGALTADAPSRPGAGIGYVFWSQSLERGDRVDSLTAGGAVMTKIYGQTSGDIGADSILLADVDADGLADVLFGSPLNSPASRAQGGDLKVIFGSTDRLPAVVDLASPSVPVYQMIAGEPDDILTYSMSVGDVDGDGVLDILTNAMGGDGVGNRHEAAGDAYVVSGRAFSSRAGRGAGAPCLTRVTVTPDLDRYYAGQTGIVLDLLCETDSKEQFVPGAVAIIRGVEVEAEFVNNKQLRVRLDDAPEVRNTPGQLTVQARNPGSDPSAAVLSITLVGPRITKAKIKSTQNGYTIKIKGVDFLPGATVSIEKASGETVPVLSVDTVKPKKIVARISRDAVAPGEVLTIRVLNPGPAPSEPATATVP